MSLERLKEASNKLIRAGVSKIEDVGYWEPETNTFYSFNGFDVTRAYRGLYLAIKSEGRVIVDKDKKLFSMLFGNRPVEKPYAFGCPPDRKVHIRHNETITLCGVNIGYTLTNHRIDDSLLCEECKRKAL